jgi:hypothetical protein
MAARVRGGSEPFDQDRMAGSEGVRAVRSRSDGGGGSEGVRVVRSESDGGGSEPFDLNRAEGMRPGKQTAAGGAAPLCGGEVAGVEAGAS